MYSIIFFPFVLKACGQVCKVYSDNVQKTMGYYPYKVACLGDAMIKVGNEMIIEGAGAAIIVFGTSLGVFLFVTKGLPYLARQFGTWSCDKP